MCRKLMYLVVVMMLGLAPMNLAYGFDPDLIAWWTCDEGAGSVVGDASGNGHDGTFVFGDPSWVDGIRGSAVQLTGPTLIEIPPLDVVLTEATMAGWIKTNGPQPDWSSFIMTRTPGLATGFNVLGFQLAYHWNDTSNSWSYRGGDMIPDNEWTFCAVTIEPDKATFYINGVAGSVNEINHAPCTWNSNIYLGGDGNDEWIPRRMNGALDDVSLFSRALTADEILALMEGIGAYPTASSPTPPDGTIISDTWINLAWRAGDFAVSHDVYLGDNFDDVDAGAESTFQGNQAATFFVVGFPGFPYPDGLDPGTTYYWRIDEVNEAEPNSPWTGKIWSFTVPPKTAYLPKPADGTELVDLDVKLSWTAGFGSKLHYVYFGDNYDEVDNAAGGLPLGASTYTPDTLEMGKTYYWRVDEFDVIDTYKGEVWSFSTEGAAKSLDPSNGSVDVTQIPVLTWSPSVFATSHQIYFGTDKDAVRNANTGSPEYKGSSDLGSETFDPGKLEWDATYYWRVDEVNNTNPSSPWMGLVWSFTTANFLIVDDFESYNDLDPADPESNRIFNAWIDGYGVPTNGSLVGYENPPFAEQTIVHGGNQSMPLFYDNSVGYSEATLTLTYPRDWTEKDINTLTIWFRGNSDNAAEPMYVALNDSAVVTHDNPDAAQITTWTQWNIDLQAFADQGVNLANVDTIALGLGNKSNPQAGGSGTMYFDDIRLFPPPPEAAP
jgi:hypothetical protein